MPCLSFRRRLALKMHSRFYRQIFFVILIIVIFLVLIHQLFASIHEPTDHLNKFALKSNSIDEFHRRDYSNSSMKPILFIGGMPRSGTTLMRAILDSHPLVRCGEETRVIPRMLSMRAAWKKSPVEWNRLMAGGMTEDILDSAVRAFIYEILYHHSKSADVLCDKDPFVLKYAQYTSSIFPNAKFILLIRDARAVIHSIMTRKVTITGFSLTDYRQNLRLWNKGIETMFIECQQIHERCLMVYYEQLVLQPKKNIEKILKFLNLPWNDDVLRHEELVGKKISLSKTEHSSDQVVKPINLEALTKWVGHMPSYLKKELDSLAPMLKRLGYDTVSDTPSYGTADPLVLENMNKLKDNADYWKGRMKIYARQPPNGTLLGRARTII